MRQTTIHRVTVENEKRLMVRIKPGLFEGDIDPIQLTHYLKQPNHFMFVALEWGVVMGVLMSNVHHHPDGRPDMFITSIAIDPSAEGRGVGAALLERVRAEAVAQGCAFVGFVAEQENQKLCRFFQYHDFGELSTTAFIQPLRNEDRRKMPRDSKVWDRRVLPPN